MEKADLAQPIPFENFQDLLRKVVSVPKSEIDEREATYKEQRARKRKKKQTKEPAG